MSRAICFSESGRVDGAGVVAAMKRKSNATATMGREEFRPCLGMGRIVSRNGCVCNLDEQKRRKRKKKDSGGRGRPQRVAKPRELYRLFFRRAANPKCCRGG